MRLKHLSALFAVCLMFLLISCTDSDSSSQKIISVTSDEAEASTGENTFAYNLFNTFVSSGSEKENIVISPIGLYQYLSIISNGADESSKTDFLNVLKCNNINTLNSLNSKLSVNLNKLDRQVTFNLANSLWIDKDFSVNTNYIDCINKSYNVDIKRVQLNSEDTKNAINEWSSNKTNGLIKILLSDRLSTNTIYLCNATYFNGKWKNPFDAEKTIKGSFFNYDGTESRVFFMNQVLEVELAKNKLYTAIKLPYGNGSFEMTAILPNDNVLIDDCVSELREIESESFGKREIYLQFPKFNVEYNTKGDLTKCLDILGLNLSNVNTSQISEIEKLSFAPQQQTIIRVDENGTEVASVTMDGYIANIPEIISFNKPFAYTIKEKSTNVILYIGVINKL